MVQEAQKVCLTNSTNNHQGTQACTTSLAGAPRISPASLQRRSQRRIKARGAWQHTSPRGSRPEVSLASAGEVPYVETVKAPHRLTIEIPSEASTRPKATTRPSPSTTVEALTPRLLHLHPGQGLRGCSTPSHQPIQTVLKISALPAGRRAMVLQSRTTAGATAPMLVSGPSSARPFDPFARVAGYPSSVRRGR